MQTDAAALYNEAVKYGLDIPEDRHRASPVECAVPRMIRRILHRIACAWMQCDEARG